MADMEHRPMLLPVLFLSLCGISYGDTAAVTVDNDVIQKLSERVDQLEILASTQKKEISDLRAKLSQNQERTSYLQQVVWKLRRDGARRRIDADQKRPDGGDSTDQEPSAEVNDASTSSQDRRRIRRQENTASVAFFSTLSNMLTHIGANQNIEFDNVVTNVGNAYHSHVGAFIAPVSGTYAFQVTLMDIGGHTTHYLVTVNGTAVSKLYVRGAESPKQSASQTVVLRLKQGDDVSVRNADADEALHGENYSSFSGFLIQQEFDDSLPIVGKREL